MKIDWQQGSLPCAISGCFCKTGVKGGGYLKDFVNISSSVWFLYNKASTKQWDFLHGKWKSSNSWRISFAWLKKEGSTKPKFFYIQLQISFLLFGIFMQNIIISHFSPPLLSSTLPYPLLLPLIFINSFSLNIIVTYTQWQIPE